MLKITTGGVSRSAKGFLACGDAFVRCDHDGGVRIAVIDALGHGPDAEVSAHRAREVVKAGTGGSLKELFAACDKALLGVRGAVMSVVELKEGAARFAGVGNVELLAPPDRARPATVAGALGRGLKHFREHSIAPQAGDRWLLVSDGIRLRGIQPVLDQARALEPEAAAKAILEATWRGDDDATVMVIDFA